MRSCKFNLEISGVIGEYNCKVMNYSCRSLLPVGGWGRNYYMKIELKRQTMADVPSLCESKCPSFPHTQRLSIPPSQFRPFRLSNYDYYGAPIGPSNNIVHDDQTKQRNCISLAQQILGHHNEISFFIQHPIQEMAITFPGLL